MEERNEKTNIATPLAPKVGVYICHCGGNISDVVDVKKVAEEVQKLPGVAVAKTNMFMCSDPGQQEIIEDVQNLGLDRVVVASCSPRLHETTFRSAVKRAGMNPYLYEHANIREQVSWVTHNDPDAATKKATGLIAAAVAKALRLESLEPIRVEAAKHALVVGGGVSGLKASLDLARKGIEVTLVEKTPFLGGNMARLDTVYPTGEKAQDLLMGLINEVIAEPSISVLTTAEIVNANGYVGNFDVQIRVKARGVTSDLTDASAAIAACPVKVMDEHSWGLRERKAIYKTYDAAYPDEAAIDWQACDRCGKCVEAVGGRGIELNGIDQIINLRAGAVIMATGFDHYEPRIGEYGWGESSNVITLPQLICLMTDTPQGGKLDWHGKPVRSIGLIHCVGSRQQEGLNEPQEDGKLNEYCSRVCCTATLQAANELKDRWPDINVYDFYQDIRTYGRGSEDYYENASRKRVLFFRWSPEDAPTVEKCVGDYPLAVRVKDRLTYGEELEVPVDLVVLAVGMMPQDVSGIVKQLKLPVGADRFLLEVHPKLRPVEVAVNGVLIAGTSQAPKDITESTASASAAAVKAASVLTKGYVELDPFVAVAKRPAKCDGCEECLAVCGYEGAIALEDGKVKVNPALCKGCGNCVSVCPHRVLDVNGWSLDQFEAMVDAIVGDGVTSDK